MATKSILKSVVIKEKKSYLLLAKALERASGTQPPVVEYSKMVKSVAKSDIKKVLGDTL